MKRRLLLLCVLALVAAVLVWRAPIAAQVRATVVLAEVLDVPVLQPAVHRVTDAPRTSEIDLSGAPTTMVRPGGGDGPWPAIVFLTGADAAGRTHKDVLALARGLARAGFVAFVPDVEGLRDATVRADTVSDGVAVTRAAAARTETRGGKVALASVSVGASLALLVAADARARDRVSAVGGIAPYADLRTVLMIATTGHYRARSGALVRYETDPFMKEVIARSVIGLLPDSPQGRFARALLARQLERADDPLAVLARAESLFVVAGQRPVAALFANRDPARFDALYEALPEDVRQTVRALSPLEDAEQLDMPVELASAPRDAYFPVEESRRIVAAAPDARLVVTSTLDHAIPRASLEDLRDLAHFDAFVVRVLRAASAPDE